jgi:hypothetical protein
MVVSGTTYWLANVIFPHQWEEVSEVRPSAQASSEDVKAYDAEKNMNL